MDEYNTGMDPEVKIYFRKIMKSFGLGLIWLLVMATLGLYFRLGYAPYGLDWYNGPFYVFFLITLVFVVRTFVNVWQKKEK